MQRTHVVVCVGTDTVGQKLVPVSERETKSTLDQPGAVRGAGCSAQSSNTRAACGTSENFLVPRCALLEMWTLKRAAPVSSPIMHTFMLNTDLSVVSHKRGRPGLQQRADHFCMTSSNGQRQRQARPTRPRMRLHMVRRKMS